MNPNDLADFSADTSDTVIRRTVVSDGHRILVVGTIPEKSIPYVSVQMDTTEIIGGMDAMEMLKDTLGDVLTEMDAAMTDKPFPCERCEGEPAFVVNTEGGLRYRVQCTKCGLRTALYQWRSDAACAWCEGDYEDDDEKRRFGGTE